MRKLQHATNTSYTFDSSNQSATQSIGQAGSYHISYRRDCHQDAKNSIVSKAILILKSINDRSPLLCGYYPAFIFLHHTIKCSILQYRRELYIYLYISSFKIYFIELLLNAQKALALLKIILKLGFDIPSLLRTTTSYQNYIKVIFLNELMIKIVIFSKHIASKMSNENCKIKTCAVLSYNLDFQQVGLHKDFSLAHGTCSHGKEQQKSHF